MKIKNPYWGETMEEPEFFKVDPKLMIKALMDVIDERKRQLEKEGWAPEHDDRHTKGELAKAAFCYAASNYLDDVQLKKLWPFDLSWWKPANKRRDLVKAAALILAEIERLDRVEKKDQLPVCDCESCKECRAKGF